MTIFAIPDLNRPQLGTCGSCDSIPVRRELGCDHPIVMVECVYFFATRGIPNFGCAVERPRDEFRRIQ